MSRYHEEVRQRVAEGSTRSRVSLPGLQNQVLLKIDKNEGAARVNVPSERSYHDIPGLRHETLDVLKQLDQNLRALEDASGRLSFVLCEVRTLIRR